MSRRGTSPWNCTVSRWEENIFDKNFLLALTLSSEFSSRILIIDVLLVNLFCFEEVVVFPSILMFRCLFGDAVNILGGLSGTIHSLLWHNSCFDGKLHSVFIFANLILLRIYCAIFVFLSLQFDCFSIYDKLNGYYAYIQDLLRYYSMEQFIEICSLSNRLLII